MQSCAHVCTSFQHVFVVDHGLLASQERKERSLFWTTGAATRKTIDGQKHMICMVGGTPKCAVPIRLTTGSTTPVGNHFLTCHPQLFHKISALKVNFIQIKFLFLRSNYLMWSNCFWGPCHALGFLTMPRPWLLDLTITSPQFYSVLLGLGRIRHLSKYCLIAHLAP